MCIRDSICLVLSEILSANVLVISRKGKILGISSCEGVEEIEELIVDQIGGFVDAMLNARLLSILSTKAVSYTHLDVYKRQGLKINYVFKERRAGDVPSCYSDATKAKEELGWVAKRGIKEMCQDSWRWQKNNPEGYVE